MTEKNIMDALYLTWRVFLLVALALLFFASCSQEELSPLAGSTYTAGSHFTEELSQSWEFVSDRECQHYRTWRGTVYDVQPAAYVIYGDRVVITPETGKVEAYTMSGSLLISIDRQDPILQSPVTYKRSW